MKGSEQMTEQETPAREGDYPAPATEPETEPSHEPLPNPATDADDGDEQEEPNG